MCVGRPEPCTNVGSGGDSAISLSLRVVRFEQTHVDNARQISGLIEWSGSYHDSAEE